jgi:transposase
VRAGTAQQLAEAAVAAARTQSLRLAGEEVAAELVAALAQQATDLGGRIATLDRQIATRFGRHRLAKVICSMPGFGFRLGAELLVAIGDLDQVDSADRLAAYAGLAPVANDSGKRTGRRRRPVRYNRALRRAMYLAALVAIRCDPAARAYYQRKRAEGKRPIQATICLARRRTNVLWALMRDDRTWQPEPPLKPHNQPQAA